MTEIYISGSGDKSFEAKKDPHFHYVGQTAVEYGGIWVDFINIGRDEISDQGLGKRVFGTLLSPRSELELAMLREGDIDSAADQLPHAA